MFCKKLYLCVGLLGGVYAVRAGDPALSRSELDVSIRSPRAYDVKQVRRPRHSFDGVLTLPDEKKQAFERALTSAATGQDDVPTSIVLAALGISAAVILPTTPPTNPGYLKPGTMAYDFLPL